MVLFCVFRQYLALYPDWPGTYSAAQAGFKLIGDHSPYDSSGLRCRCEPLHLAGTFILYPVESHY